MFCALLLLSGFVACYVTFCTGNVAMLPLLPLTFFVVAFFRYCSRDVIGSHGCLQQRTSFCGISYFRICFLQIAVIK